MRAVLTAVGASVAGVLVIVVLVVVVLAPRGGSPEPTSSPDGPTWAAPAAVPDLAASPGPGLHGLVDPAWVSSASEATGIPPVALAAYAGVALWKATEMPSCELSWNLLAAIGAVESDHGRHGGASVDASGDVTPPIFGVALDGDGVATIPDTDGGAIDGDAEHDRAVGPMQLIPETWRNWHVDGSGDGVEDPHNIVDAVTAAANYLCRSATGLASEEGWAAAVASYNSPEEYRMRVAAFATEFADAVG